LGLLTRRALAAAIVLLAPAAAHADTVWVGVYRHDITWSDRKYESGADLKAGWISEPIAAVLPLIGRPSIHVIASKSLDGGTDYIAVGIDRTFGGRIYLRPGIGVAVNDGKRPQYSRGRRVDLGSTITFEPELALGLRLGPHLAVEASWIHLSHARLFSHQNRGMDSMGVRTLVHF
jgi:hypothetical protein